jgi:hypothetical protein
MGRMRRVVVLLSICAGLGALGIIACGGDPKPPLTPDNVEHDEPTLGGEAGASSPAGPAGPASPAAPTPPK